MENIDVLKSRIWTAIGQQDRDAPNEPGLEGYIRPEM